MFRKRLFSRVAFAACVPLAATTLGVTAGAQSFQHMQRPKDLSPAEVSTLEHLHQLSMLPDGPWRMHEGDLPHGESSTLDDSSWTTVTGDPQKPAVEGKGAVWFQPLLLCKNFTLSG